MVAGRAPPTFFPLPSSLLRPPPTPPPPPIPPPPPTAPPPPPAGPPPPRIVHHVAVEPGEHPAGDQHDAVDGPLVDVVHEELALEGHIGRAEDLRRPPGRRRVARPASEAAGQAGDGRAGGEGGHVPG